jgi:toxin-antitoxin system PIN domain toxin
MSRYLLDVNVLLALARPGHEAYAVAHAWLEKSRRQGWATNPLTELGVLRLLTNPSVTRGVVSAATALAVVAAFTRTEGHEFWPLDREIAPCLKPISSKLRGHRQWTDAMLLWHAKERGGVLVTFDSGLKELAGRESAAHVLVLKSR